MIHFQVFDIFAIESIVLYVNGKWLDRFVWAKVGTTRRCFEAWKRFRFLYRLLVGNDSSSKQRSKGVFSSLSSLSRGYERIHS